MATSVTALKSDVQALSIPTCEKGLGKLILSPASADLIEGVKVAPYSQWPDDRGYYIEIVLMGQGLAANYSPATTQVSAALSYPGTIKAFHYHQYQTDFWVPAM